MTSRIQVAKRLADLGQIKHKAVQEVPDLVQIARDNLEILAALIFAKMKGKSSVEEEASGVLVIQNDQGSWKIVLRDDSLSLTGFRNSPNLTQFLAKLNPEKHPESGFWIKIAETAIKLIERSYEKETKPPVKFQSPQSPGSEEDSEHIPSGTLAPANPEQDSGEAQLSLDDSELGLPDDSGLGLGSAPPGPGEPGMTPGMPPGPAGQVPGQPPAPMPQAPAPTPPVNQGTF